MISKLAVLLLVPSALLAAEPKIQCSMTYHRADRKVGNDSIKPGQFCVETTLEDLKLLSEHVGGKSPGTVKAASLWIRNSDLAGGEKIGAQVKIRGSSLIIYLSAGKLSGRFSSNSKALLEGAEGLRHSFNTEIVIADGTLLRGVTLECRVVQPPVPEWEDCDLVTNRETGATD